MRLGVWFVFFSLGVNGYAQVVEAENGILVGTTVGTQHNGYTGTGYVTGFDADNDKVTMTVNSPSRGIYNLHIRYACPFGEKYNFIFVNGENLGSVHFPASNDFKETLVGKVFLNNGTNTVAVVKEWGYFELDNIRLEASVPSEIDNVVEGLVTPSASVEATDLYAFLSKIYGNAIISGQYGGDAELNRIQTLSGKKPLMRGFDLIDYSPSRVEHGASSTETEKAIAWHAQKGIVTFAWHWNAPMNLIDQPGKEWWRGFYTDATTFDVTVAMNDPSSQAYNLIIRDIDAIALQLKKLKDANVPVLWRPLHEAEGAWFWWGAKGAEPCKWLWKLVFDRLVNYHQINNLIWIWTSTASSAAMEWYPGDEYVDIVGADIYLPPGSYSSNLIMFDNLAALFEGRKIITLSENGPIPDPDRLFEERAAWNWFCTWGGDFILDGNFNSTSHVNAVYNHEYVITLDELDDVDEILAALERKRADGEVILSTEDTRVPPMSYANPVRNNRLIISSKTGATISNVVIYSAHGKIEFDVSNTLHEKELEFDFTGKSAGLYLLVVETKTSTQKIRILKI